jgi:hypothetical protein
MDVRATSTEDISVLLQTGAQSLRISHYLLLILEKFRRFHLFHSGCYSGNSVIVRSTLKTGKDRLIYSILYVIHNLLAVLCDASNAFSEENNTSAGTSEKLNRKDIIILITD